MKKILILAVAGLMMGAAKADYSLYWNASSGSEFEGSFSYVMLKYTLNSVSDYLNVTTTAGEAAKVRATDGATGSYFSNLGTTDWSGYTFMAEAFDSADKLVGSSGAVAYSDLAGSVYTDMDKATAYQFQISNVPEPTSGLLLLLGVAGLALRRKRGRDVLVASGNTCGRDVLVASGNTRGRDVLVASI